MSERAADSSRTALDAPRRVRGGVRLRARQWPPPLGWAARRWLRIVDEAADAAALEEGLAYARAGQTRGLEIEPGRIVASVQGRALKAYRIVIQLECFSDQQWQRIVEGIATQPRHGAPLLAGELPESILDLFDTRGLALLPTSPADLLVTTTCPGSEPWTKHVCCVALLMAEILDRDPGSALTLRGLPLPELMDRVRDHRSDLGAQGSSRPAPTALETDLSQGRPSARPLEACLEEFWEAGPGLDRVETPIEPPDVSHPLLRRLGPSPFEGSRFPLVGLLATCYDMMSRAAISGAQQDPMDTAPPD